MANGIKTRPLCILAMAKCIRGNAEQVEHSSQNLCRWLVKNGSKRTLHIKHRNGYTASLWSFICVFPQGCVAPLMCWEAMPAGARLTACSVKSCVASSLANCMQRKVETRLSVFLRFRCRRMFLICQATDTGFDWQSIFLQMTCDDSCFHFQKEKETVGFTGERIQRCYVWRWKDIINSLNFQGSH